ncbi:kinesin-like protein KIF28P [Dromiciops gliroides]|uniref:kinesin-like protein KIF28P n=1 Tax=Dromiciops gliroides TaxID=33562 RepID=UPI001CC54249|nr:kinesin-like protein KIF28P [Dromiciops gliroides]
MEMPSVDSVKVAVRVRPFNQREKNAGSRCVISMHSGTTTTIHDPKNPEHIKTFTFDLAYWSHNGFQRDKDGVLISTGSNSEFAGQRDVFRDLGQGVLDSAWQGYNATLLAYGQTGSGKSYSMIGYGADKGIIPNVCEELFKTTEHKEKNQQQQQVTFSMLEIYNEQVRDLLSKTKKPGGLKVREDQHQGFYVDGLTSVPCDSYTQIERLMEQGIKARTTAATSMNATSSRSHMVITIQFKQVFLDGDLTKQSIINLVDLAGSERQKSSGSEGDRLREGSRVNLSLTTLGNVISALADVAIGKRVLHIPYRDSVLTRLLQSALGGNSRTIMIATISPADICYEETLSTLRYAERTKKIKNKAVINTSPTEKLIKELKAENNRLLSRLAGLGNSGKRELECLLAKNQLRLQTIQITWEHQLEEAQKEWEEQYSAITQERQMTKAFPYLFNVNEDPQLTGVLKHFIQAGSSVAGQAASNKIILQGLGISDKHATFTNMAGEVTVTPQSKCRVVINGVPTVTKTKLQHLDRVILGSNSAYLYIGFPSERSHDDLARFDYDFFQSELAAAEGVSVDKLGAVNNKDGKVDPSVLAVFQDYIKLIPLVAEANQMSEELMKGLKLELKVKNLASSDSKGYDLQKEVVVKVTNRETQEVWIWSKAKFINRKYLMEEIYQHFLDGEDISVAQDDDPFWDPIEAIHLGSAHVWLQSLAYCMKLEEQAELLNSEGLEEAIVLINIIPCSSTGEVCGEDDVVIDPLELLGKRIDFQIQIIQCLGVKWLKEDARRGIQIGYKVYDLPITLYTKPVWKNVNAKIEETVHFVALNASHEFLNYLQKNALIVDLWGLQEGCAELNCTQKDLITWEGNILVDNMKTLTAQEATPNQMAELYLKLLKLEQETELLRNINRALREENVLLKDSLKACSPGQDHKLSGASRITVQSTSHRDTPRTSYDADFAKALKVFYQSMNTVRGQFLKLRHHRLPVRTISSKKDTFSKATLTHFGSFIFQDDDQMLRPYTQRQSHLLKDIGELLEASLWKLKNDVALIVKKKRESLVHTKYRGSSFP